jgi:hypothetical protein
MKTRCINVVVEVGWVHADERPGNATVVEAIIEALPYEMWFANYVHGWGITDIGLRGAGKHEHRPAGFAGRHEG